MKDYYPGFTTAEEWNARNRLDDEKEAAEKKEKLLEKYKEFPWAKEALEAGWAPPDRIKELEDKIEELGYEIMEIIEWE